MIVVPDTNVLVAALVAKGLCTEVVLHCIRQRSLVSSARLLGELDRTLQRKFEVTPAVAKFLELFRSDIRIVEPVVLAEPVCRDSDDDVVLATALAAGADLVLTGDQDLLVLRAYEGIAIMTPRQYLEQFI